MMDHKIDRSHCQLLSNLLIAYKFSRKGKKDRTCEEFINSFFTLQTLED